MAAEPSAPAVAARPRRLALVGAVPVWAWLAVLVAVSAAVRYLLSRDAVAPWVMVDELIYSELAKSFAATGHFLVRGQATGAYGVVYPLLISPAWAAFHAVPDAYQAAKAINSLAMSLAAVPAYLLARRVLRKPFALLAAALALAVPSMVYTGTLMTENAFYPVFLLAALAMVAWLEQPSARRTLLLAAAFVVAYETRPQAIVLLPALLTAPLLLSGRRAWREYRLMYGLAGVGVALVLIVEGARGRSPLAVLGAYQAATDSSYSVGGVVKWFLYHVAELDLSVGVLPFAALLLLAAVSRGLPRPVRVFVAASVALAFWLVLEVAVFASQASVQRIEERNMFYLAPLFLIALLVWIEQGLPRPARAAGLAALVAAALPGALPYPSLISLGARSDTIALLPLWALEPRPFGLPQLGALVVVCSLAAIVLLLLVPARYALVLPALVLAYFAVSQQPIQAKRQEASVGSLYAGIGVPHRDWIDRAVGGGADVIAIWTGNADRFTIWENGIFNRSIRAVYRTPEAAGFEGGLKETTLDPDLASGLLRVGDQPVVATYALADRSLTLDGTVVAQDDRTGMTLYRLHGPLRQTTRVDGLYPDTWSRRTVVYTRLGCTGGTVAAALRTDGSTFKNPQHVVAVEAGRQVGAAVLDGQHPATLTVRLLPVAGTCTVTYTVSPTAVPAQVSHGQNPDPRTIGVHFDSFTYSP